eukprot:TRINITY_DN82578_c0_g1_i1.p1 TRINITY_DN82578_c0_g1~~TRINITY_DN82578_c0_g1_i1.p1  ORF type:complete len:202 (-),score=26.17 TRINITY_DN82578_c0_g1_i1:57-662(-)
MLLARFQICFRSGYGGALVSSAWKPIFGRSSFGMAKSPTATGECEQQLGEETLKLYPSRRAFVAAGLLGQRRGVKVRSSFDDVTIDFELPAGDPVRGHTLFKKHCGHCHSINADNRMSQQGGSSIGPTLFGICGRASGEEPLQQKQLIGSRVAGLIWTDGALMNYMKNPREAAQANVQMNFRGIDDFQTRVDIIHYLKTLV